MVELQPSKLAMRVRSPSPAPRILRLFLMFSDREAFERKPIGSVFLFCEWRNIWVVFDYVIKFGVQFCGSFFEMPLEVLFH